MMARRPADINANKAHGCTHQDIWEAVRKREDVFTVNDIDGQMDIELDRKTVRDYLNRLVMAGYLKDEGTRQTRSPKTPGERLYRLVKNPSSDAPKIRRDGSENTAGLGTENMWRSLKIMGSFTAEELVVAANSGNASVSFATAKDYLRHLMNAGYVRVIQEKSNKRRRRYAFIRANDPGPLAPQIQRIKRVFDPNSKTVVWPKKGASDDS